jgi:hypothetical protein
MTANVPATDLRAPVSDHPNDRRGSLAEQLAALMAFRNRPEGPIEPLKTNWTVVPANDNASSDEIAEYSHERVLRMTPSVDEVMRQVATGDVEKNVQGQVVRIGALHFSDGTQTEKAYKVEAERIKEYDRRMPAGALLGCREKAEAALGGRGYSGSDLKRSNEFFSETLGTLPARSVKRVPRRNGRGYSRAEMQAALDEAIANTAVMPEVKYLPPGLPCGSERIADSFVGMKVSVSGGTGAIGWQDISDSIVQREVWDTALANMRADDIGTLEAAQSARNYADVGQAAGQAREYARRKGGKRALWAANDNLAAALRKAAG